MRAQEWAAQTWRDESAFERKVTPHMKPPGCTCPGRGRSLLPLCTQFCQGGVAAREATARGREGWRRVQVPVSPRPVFPEHPSGWGERSHSGPHSEDINSPFSVSATCGDESGGRQRQVSQVCGAGPPWGRGCDLTQWRVVRTLKDQVCEKGGSVFSGCARHSAADDVQM